MKKFFFILFLLLITTSLCHAGCVDTFGIGAKATSLGGAFSAYADDAFAAYYNPSGLGQLEGLKISGGFHAMFLKMEIEDFKVSNTDNPNIKGPIDFTDDSSALFVPHLGVAMPIGDRLAVGLAAYVPWGLQTQWEDDPTKNPAAYNYYEGYFLREVVTPTLSYKISDKLSVGFGVSIGKSKGGEKRKVYISPDLTTYSNIGKTAGEVVQSMFDGASKILAAGYGDPENWEKYAVTDTLTASKIYQGAYAKTKDQKYGAYATVLTKMSNIEGTQKPYTVSDVENYYNTTYEHRGGVAHGEKLEVNVTDDFNYSFNIGMMYKPLDTITLGLTYRSRTDVKMEGDAKQDGTKVSEVTVEDWDHPDQIQAGIRYEPHDKFSIELDIVWTNWSINKLQKAELKTPIYINILDANDPAAIMFNKPVFISEHERNWEDTRQVRVGCEYILNEIVTLRGGYFYDPSPIPDDTMDLLWPDADKKIYSLGAGFNFGKFSIDAVVQYADVEHSRIIGGESENVNHSYDVTELYGREVSLKADGNVWGVGLTFNYEL
ncbi:MAG: outer membrane protein transport protein [Desulfobacterales bacterium]|nr:outer membrane protein transport protein [Desulfobacterales bacterium]